MQRSTLTPRPPRPVKRPARRPAHKGGAAHNQQTPNPADAEPGFAARRVALQLCDAVFNRGESLDMMGNALLKGLHRPEDRALAIAITTEVMRWAVDLDQLMDSATRLPLAPDAKARAVLRLMLAQALRLETPPHAVIATSLPLLEGGPRRLAHGVFGNLLRGDARLPAVPSLPDAVAQRWADYPLDTIAAAIASPPPLDLALRSLDETADWAQRLEGTSLLPGHVRLARGSAVERLEGYEEGAWWVQDIAASLPARLLGAGEGRSVLDLCAAPGGKAMQMAAAGWQVHALDKSKRRLSRLEENIARTGLPVTLAVADLLEWQPDAPADAILLDAPCTATGICRRHPDVLHRVRAPQIAELAALQAALLDRAIGWLKPGGTMIYAVCSLERAEGEDQIAALLSARDDLALDPIRAEELPAGITPAAQGWLRTHPGMLADAGGLDGFFMARIIRCAPM